MNTDETINKEELTLQNTPKAVNYLINEIAEMRVLLEHIITTYPSFLNPFIC